MFKKFLQTLLCSVFCVGCFISTPAHAVKCSQHGRTSVFAHTDAEDISRTVDAMWAVYDVLKKHHGKTLPPEAAAGLIIEILDGHGLNSFESRNGTTLSHAIACAIFHARSGLCDITIDTDTNSCMHWFHPVSCDELSVATYKVVEEFKKAGYVEGSNNYVALLSKCDVIDGVEPDSPLFHLCAIPRIESSGGRASAIFGELMDVLGDLAWPD